MRIEESFRVKHEAEEQTGWFSISELNSSQFLIIIKMLCYTNINSIFEECQMRVLNKADLFDNDCGQTCCLVQNNMKVV